jgi:metallo-beta-lactamase class B
MESPPARGGRGGPPAALPKHDEVLIEGQPVVLGDFKLTPFAVPGHTPGSMGFIFPVKDNGKTYMAAMYAGTVLTPGFVSDEGLTQYAKSVPHFEEETRKAKVEVELQNHPLMDPIQPKLDLLKARKPADRNPFVVGRTEYQKFLEVMAACTEVNIARRKGL